MKIVGHFDLGTGLTADGCHPRERHGVSALRSHPRSPDEPSFGLVRLQAGRRRRCDCPADAGAPPPRTCRAANSGEVEVLTRAEAIHYELDRWIRETSIGMIFQLGVAVSLLVGTVIVYQVLSSDVAAHLRQYATLKAMGYTNRFLGGRRARAGRRTGPFRLPARIGDLRMPCTN